MTADEFLAAEWPATARRIGGTLARYGVPACDRDDILQETALRLYRSWDSIDLTRGVEPFARTVALNLMRDAARRPAVRGEVLGDVPDVADSGDLVERTTIARLDLRGVRTALTRLRSTDRRVIHEALTSQLSGDDAVVPPAVRMARMRARRELVAVLRAASVWAGLVAAVRRALRTGKPVSATAVAVVVAITMLGPGTGAHSTPLVRLDPAGIDAASRRDYAPASRPLARAAVASHAAAVRPVARHATADEEPQPVHIDLPGGSRVSVVATADLGGLGKVAVGDRGDNVPVCATTPAGPVDPRLDCS